MADMTMPFPEPCRFKVAWLGKCGKPTDNGWCTKHEQMVCASCGQKAVRECDCGVSLCVGCTHSPVSTGPRHVTQEVAEEMFRQRREEEKVTTASRTSSVQRMDPELGVPINLFELLKGGHSRHEIKEFFFLELEHGLMGFFPAIIAETGRMIITIDPLLLKRVWETLTPRRSKMGTGYGYIVEKDGVAYVYAITGQSDYDKESSKPDKLLTSLEFEELTKGNAHPFEWAPGLVGPGMNREEFFRTLKAAM